MAAISSKGTANTFLRERYQPLHQLRRIFELPPEVFCTQLASTVCEKMAKATDADLSGVNGRPQGPPEGYEVLPVGERSRDSGAWPWNARTS